MAGITINIVFSENGIIAKAKEAANLTNQAVINEQEELNKAYNWIESEIINDSSNIEVNPPEKYYEITINYVYAEGEEGDTQELPARNFSDGLEMGHSYSIASPEISGYVAVPESISGIIDGKNENFTVIYYKDENGNDVPDSKEPTAE